MINKIRLSRNMCIIFGAICLALGGYWALEGMRETHWPTCDGTITSVTEHRVYRHRRTTTQYRTEYKYAVNGRNYENNEDLPHAYRRDDIVRVHYNPSKPAESTIEPEREEYAGIGFAVVGAFLIVLGLLRKPKPEQAD